jgi:hypothetical protein
MRRLPQRQHTLLLLPKFHLRGDILTPIPYTFPIYYDFRNLFQTAECCEGTLFSPDRIAGGDGDSASQFSPAKYRSNRRILGGAASPGARIRDRLSISGQAQSCPLMYTFVGRQLFILSAPNRS